MASSEPRSHQLGVTVGPQEKVGHSDRLNPKNCDRFRQGVGQNWCFYKVKGDHANKRFDLILFGGHSWFSSMQNKDFFRKLWNMRIPSSVDLQLFGPISAMHHTKLSLCKLIRGDRVSVTSYKKLKQRKCVRHTPLPQMLTRNKAAGTSPVHVHSADSFWASDSAHWWIKTIYPPFSVVSLWSFLP